MDITEFKNRIKKVSKKREITVTNSFGNNDAYRDYSSLVTKPNRLDSPKYRALINKVNALIAMELFETGFIKFPVGMGSLTLYMKERMPKMIDGKLHYNAPIDWNRTLELWATDPESRVAKTLLKMPPGKTYNIKFHTTRRNYVNREYIQFSPTRNLKLQLKERIVNNKPLAYKQTKTY